MSVVKHFVSRCIILVDLINFKVYIFLTLFIDFRSQVDKVGLFRHGHFLYLRVTVSRQKRNMDGRILLFCLIGLTCADPVKFIDCGKFHLTASVTFLVLFYFILF